MIIVLLIGSPTHPINAFAQDWIAARPAYKHTILISYSHDEITQADVIFLLSYPRIVPQSFLDQFPLTIVLHASDLPIGRGWSPHTWQILEGSESITISAISAAEALDTGDIWCKTNIHIPPSALYHEINDLLFNAEFILVEQTLTMVHNGDKPVPQDSRTPTYYPRRRPSDSEVNPLSSIDSIFNLLRVSDPIRFPVYFYKNGVRYTLFLGTNSD